MVEGNKILAKNEKGEVVLETRGQGGYIYHDPRYKIIQGSFDRIPTISAEKMEHLMEICRSFNDDSSLPEHRTLHDREITKGYKITPWDAYNKKAAESKSIRDDLMTSAGMSYSTTKGPREYYLRDGSLAPHSGNYHQEQNLFYFFSTSIKYLPPNEGLTPFAIYAYVKCRGDFSRAARELASEGFGEKISQNGSLLEADLYGHDLADMVRACKIDFSKTVEPPPICLAISNGLDQTPFASLGNFLLVIGKAKSKKSFFTMGFIIAALKGTYHNIKGSLAQDRRRVILFDTEQAGWLVQKRTRVVLDQIHDQYHDNFEAYTLRKHTPAERLKIIEQVIASKADIGLVIIDGIRDLVTSINDEEQATEVTSRLLKWTEERQIHICTVLHQNKGDTNARGHLGTECLNKAETTISITKDEKNPDLSIVDFEYCRGLAPPKFGFRVVDGLPKIEGVKDLQGEKGRANPQSWHKGIVIELLERTYKNSNGQLSYSELRNALQNVLREDGWQFGKNDAELLVTHLVTEGLLQKTGTSGTKNCKYTFRGSEIK